MIKVEVTKEALEYLGSMLGADEETAEEMGQAFIGLCRISGESDFLGRCYRHRLSFIPSPQFDNNCPACYWEAEAKKGEIAK